MAWHDVGNGELVDDEWGIGAVCDPSRRGIRDLHTGEDEGVPAPPGNAARRDGPVDRPRLWYKNMRKRVGTIGGWHGEQTQIMEQCK